MNDIRTRAEALIAAGRPGEARTAARDALDADGPDAGLYLALGRAHMAEDDDDHDDAAERVFREGLDAFPDDIGLLGGYAELHARTDAFERPGRFARGEAISARLRELAPHSAEARRAEAAGSSVPAGTGNAVSERRVQSFDAARAFAAGPTPADAAAQTAQWAARAPYDRRLAVLAETTAALAAPGRAWLRLLLCRASEYRLLVAALVALLVVLRSTVLPMPYGVTAAVFVLLSLPDLALRRLLRQARERAAARAVDAVPSADDSPAPEGFGPPELPPVPRVTRREYAFAGAGLVLALVVGVAAYGSSVSYPRYEIVAHDSYGGAEGYDLQKEYDPFGAVPAAEVEGAMARVYGEELVAVRTGDFHDMRASYVQDGGFFTGMEAFGTVHDAWNADAGPYGGWMRCIRVTERETGSLRAMCLWADKGSIGTTSFEAEHLSQRAVETKAQETRKTFLHPTN
ncbi:hypothetical protein [Streptomyces sp. NPDC058486]|uniref:hypothetical protein n=1 Tax=unclassified Streptomyces TaxID=2593676 RepID=UPI00365B6B32